ncbi:MAG: hypothetical protein P4L46_17960, partial [Fimbriimonas sp.]|nr:hypothetical protein [Fimbriimonas sp.]
MIRTYRPESTVTDLDTGWISSNSFTYDTFERPSTIQQFAPDQSSYIQHGYTYDPDGHVTVARTNGATTFYSYNALGQLIQLENVTADGYPDQYAPSAYRMTDPYTGIPHTIFSSFTNIGYNTLG